MAKFKIGDKVIAKNGAPYAITSKGWTGEVVGTLKNPNGYEIWCGDIKVENEEDGPFSVESKYFDLVNEPQKIVITTDGVKTTTARLYEGKRVIKTAIAKCSPDDEFDFSTGAKIAFNRLFANDLWDKFEAGEIDVKVTRDNVMRFLKLCEERNIKWRGGERATDFNPYRDSDSDNEHMFINDIYIFWTGLGYSDVPYNSDVVEAAVFFVDQNVTESDEPKFTKADLKNGMFVIMSDGNIGVVVNDIIVYESGGFDRFDQMSDDMDYCHYRVTGVVTGVSFDDAKRTFEHNTEGVIYRRK